MITRHTYKPDPNGWGIIQRFYAHRTILEKYMMAWLEKKIIPLKDKDIDRMLIMINQEMTAYIRHHTHRMGSMTIQKVPAGKYFTDQQTRWWKIILVSGNRFPFFEISEPLR